MADAIYTPSSLACAVINSATCRRPSIVADFCAGDGGLLRAAQERWPSARMVATDTELLSLAGLRKRHPDWRVGRSDFLSVRSRAKCAALGGLKASLVVMNPPFSCRGGTRHSVRIQDEQFTCSTAMAFVATAMRYLSARGQMVAIVPAGSPKSEKDADIWKAIRICSTVHTVGRSGRGTFAGCHPSVAVVRIGSPRYSRLAGWSAESTTTRKVGPQEGHSIRIVRGIVQMHTLSDEVNEKGLVLVHTTNVSKNRVLLDGNVTGAIARAFPGPAVLLPRVCEPSQGKIAVYLEAERIVLSDCLFGLLCDSRKQAQELAASLRGHWQAVKAAYGGTCARYLTRANLAALLRRLGFVVAEGGDG